MTVATIFNIIAGFLLGIVGVLIFAGIAVYREHARKRHCQRLGPWTKARAYAEAVNAAEVVLLEARKTKPVFRVARFGEHKWLAEVSDQGDLKLNDGHPIPQDEIPAFQRWVTEVFEEETPQ